MFSVLPECFYLNIGLPGWVLSFLSSFLSCFLTSVFCASFQISLMFLQILLWNLYFDKIFHSESLFLPCYFFKTFGFYLRAAIASLISLDDFLGLLKFSSNFL